MARREGIPTVIVALIFGAFFAFGAVAAEASHLSGSPKKHKIVYHFNGSDSGDHVKKAKAVLDNIQNHANGLGGWKNIEDFVLVVHGDGVIPFVEKSMDIEVRKRVDMLMTSGMKLGVCGNTLKAKKLELKQFSDGAVRLDQGGVTAVGEYQEKGYVYIKP
ncbi:MAG: DsrE family protein [Nitrospirae bacterium]|nr:DsrE family protein [Nitrospirota bacterium]